MNILIASNPYKEFASSQQVGTWIAEGLHCGGHTGKVRILPMADGGEGTMAAFLHAHQGELQPVRVRDARYRSCDAHLAVYHDDVKTAVIEIAQACGSARITPEERNTMIATSYGVGELIVAALDGGCQRIIIGLGGSMVSDAGMGAAQALGAHFYDANHQELTPIGCQGFNVQSLPHVCRIDVTQMDARLATSEVLIAADVETPLLGVHGQAPTFGPQKGATPEQIVEMGKAHEQWHAVLRETFQQNFDLPYAGAAGGLGAGLSAFTGGALCSGGTLVLQHHRFHEALTWSDVVVTGEGRLDRTTMLGKGPLVVAQQAKAQGQQVVCVVGGVDDSFDRRDFPCDALFTTSDRGVSWHRSHIQQCGARIANLLN
jgi:glycerate 2-kinase